MTDKLLPCPFCGGKATISDGGYSGEKFLVRCRELSCPAASGFIRKTHDEAVAAWNRRSDAMPVVCGEWVNFVGDFSTAECNKCGEVYEVSPDENPCEDWFNAFKQFYKYCPNCGCDMRGERDGEK